MSGVGQQHRSLLTGKAALAVAGVGKRRLRDFQQEHLHGIYRCQTARRNSVLRWIEDDVFQKPAPLRDDAIFVERIGGVVVAPVPLIFRHFFNGIDLIEDVLPVGFNVIGFREHAGHADDGNRLGRLARLLSIVDRDGDAAHLLVQYLLAARSNLFMQFGDGDHAVMHGGHLANHIHAARPLLVIVDRDQSIGSGFALRAAQSLAGNTQATEIHHLQFLANFFASLALRLEVATLFVEYRFIWRVDASDRMSGTGLQQDRFITLNSGFLKAFDNGAGIDGFLSEQVSSADQHADLDAPRRQWGGEGGHHGRGQSVMDAAGKKHVVGTGIFARCDAGKQHIDHRFPEHEAAARSDVPAAFFAFKDEPARTHLDKRLEQKRRRHMQIGGDAAIFHGFRLVRTSAGDQSKWRFVPLDHFHLFLAQLLRDKPEHADAPRQVAESLFGFFNQFFDLASAHQRQCEKRQRAAFCNFERELGRVADPGHGALYDRILGLVRASQR